MESNKATQILDREQHLAMHIRLALDESERAVSTAITNFSRLAIAAQDIAECTLKMKSWETSTDPLYNNTVNQVADCSVTINRHIEQIIEMFQFQDRVRQRLEYTVSILDGVCLLEENEHLRHPPLLTVANNASAEADEDNIVLF